ncbi:MAG: rhodanese-like domain-containing protein [Candidatus Zixiibacteriota bacterium]
MNLITREELKETIDRGDKFKLIMVLGDWQYRAKHIPGSINISSPEDPKVKELSKDDEIVVYCSNVHCAASMYAYQVLENAGFKVQRYAGGILDWEEAGYPLEGEWAN